MMIQMYFINISHHHIQLNKDYLLITFFRFSLQNFHQATLPLFCNLFDSLSNNIAAPVNGNWGEWGPFSDCTAGCGGGQKTQRRFCDNPRPSHGGQQCQGHSIFTVACNSHSCYGKFV